MRIHSLDSVRRIRTKKIRSIDLTNAGATATPIIILFRPNFGHKFMLKQVFSHVRKAVGTITDAANLLIDNGVDGQNLVASVALSTTEGAVKQHTMASTTLYIDHTNPVRMKVADGATGATTFLADVVLELVELSGE